MDKFVILFEFAPPFRWKGKREQFGPMTRLIWGWFSVAYFHQVDINTMFRAYREDERQRCADIVDGLAERRNPASWEAEALRRGARVLRGEVGVTVKQGAAAVERDRG